MKASNLSKVVWAKAFAHQLRPAVSYPSFCSNQWYATTAPGTGKIQRLRADWHNPGTG